MHSDTYVIIPVYNEGGAVAGVVRDVLGRFEHVVCVNDGSTDDSAAQIATTGAMLVDHPVNLGQGAALQTGIEFALQDPDAAYFVTFDADGQHSLSDAEKMLECLKAGEVDIVLGSRFLGTAEGMSRLRRAVLKLAIRFNNAASGLKLTDAHNGLRVFNRHVAENLHITLSDMAHASEIAYRIAQKKFRYVEYPVTITYTDYSRAKGQSSMNAINIAFDVLMHRVTKS